MFARLLLLFIVVPIVELFLFSFIGSRIGLWPTLAIIVITAILGAALTRSQGRQALMNFQQALAQGRMPHQEVTDGLLILIAGAVLLTPGFLTDAVGFALLMPPVRQVLRGRLADSLKSKIVVGSGPAQESRKPSKLDDGKVIDV